MKLVFLTLFSILLSLGVSAQTDTSCVFIPNTVCGDCENGTLFQPYFGCSITECEFIVYDRFGKVLHESKTLKPEFEAYGLADGTYWYSLKGKYADGNVFNIESSFTYLR